MNVRPNPKRVQMKTHDRAIQTEVQTVYTCFQRLLNYMCVQVGSTWENRVTTNQLLCHFWMFSSTTKI